ncbi:hypothetical protein H9N25_11870 [Pedobacter riviphilus]|uniref:Uncharacterized protein n=1 Tax=Pedobacter riviphilus TaxID=2766984 RepID=A0ABX6TN58_9SPHI|nr:hypothetical protein [Pedobacter riviphilus]QNR87022.1 hypothetical protein H9N25_11870 [Pedobacter riviphilus]
MKRIYKSIFFIGISVFGICLIAYGGTSLIKGFTQHNDWPTTAIVQKETDIDPKLVEKFTKISVMVNPSGVKFKVTGKINITNPVDSTQNLHNLGYIYQKQGDQYYYQSGQTETINADGLLVYVDHAQKKIMLGKNKGEMAPLVFPDLSNLIKQFKEEKYQLWDRRTDKQYWTISLINPTHITCKLYELTYDSLTLKPNKIVMRLSNFDDPLNNKKDKKVSFEIMTDTQVNASLFHVGRFVEKKQPQSYVPAEKYKDYELIVLPELR